MIQYKKLGYLHKDFVYFHLKDKENKHFSYHYHDFHKILFFLNGTVTYQIEGQHYLLQPNDIVLIRAGQIHRPFIASDTEYERIILYVSKEFLAQYEKDGYILDTCFLQARQKNTNVIRGNKNALSDLFYGLKKLELATTHNDFANELYQNSLFLSFLIELNRMVLKNETDYIERNETSNQMVIDVSSYILENLTKDLSVEKIAARFYLNRYYLMHLFKRETGCTITNYITQKRLLHSIHLLTQGYSATESCFQSGYKNYSTFSRAFQKEFHTCPKEYLKTRKDTIR